MERRIPSKDEVLGYLRKDRNWGRWGPDDQVGAVNLVTPEKRLAACKLVRSGRAVSLGREYPKIPAGYQIPDNKYIKHNDFGRFGSAVDYFFGPLYHGTAGTHMDALCHQWVDHEMWNGRNSDECVTDQSAEWGSIHHWKEGIITRGVLLDVLKHRGGQFVTMDKPVQGWELEDIVKKEGLTLEPGDALVVNCGRDVSDPPWESTDKRQEGRAGLHGSCLKFIRQSDCCLLVWDMKDHTPNEYGLQWTVGLAAYAYGIAFVDNAYLEPLAKACAEEGRYEFMLTVSPLQVVGGTGSPVNPIALL